MARKTVRESIVLQGGETKEYIRTFIYGPVSSWRLGRSLGIDLLFTRGKTCSFDCIYCQLGGIVQPLAERRDFISLDKLVGELEKVKDIAADYATFSGMGEPTLAANLGEAIRLVKSVLGLPVAVLTNSSLMAREDVRHELSLAEVVVAKVDAPNEKLFRQINRPIIGTTLNEILNALQLFRGQYRGTLALQMMFVEPNKGYATEMARIAKQLSPDEVQINTPLRPCAVQPLLPEDISIIRQAFSELKRVVTVYEVRGCQVTPLHQ